MIEDEITSMKNASNYIIERHNKSIQKFKNMFSGEDTLCMLDDAIVFLNSKYCVFKGGSIYHLEKYQRELTPHNLPASFYFLYNRSKNISTDEALVDQELPKRLKKIILFNLDRFIR